MTSSPIELKPFEGLPASVQAMLHPLDATAVVAALENGLPGNLASAEGVPLYEYVLEALETQTRPVGDVSVPPAPMGLLHAFVQHGLTKQPFYDGQASVVSMALHYGQWGWAQALLEQGYPVEGPQGSALLALVDGRLQRAVIPGQAVLETPAGHPPATALTSNVHWLGPAPAEDDSISPAVWMSDSAQEHAAVGALVEQLVKTGARLEFQEKTPDESPGMTPLMRAIVNLDRTCVEALCSAGANLEARPEGLMQRPLELAIAGGSEGVVRALIAAGAPLGPDPSLPEAQALMNRPLVLAARRGVAHLIPVIAEAMEKSELTRWGTVAMHFAAAQGHVPVLTALRVMGIPYSARSIQGGYTPLHQAASGGHPETIAFLLRRGQKWDVANDNGVTAADVLRSRHPGLVARFGLETANNVHVLFPHRSKPRR